jgi:subtilisin family serine protease
MILIKSIQRYLLATVLATLLLLFSTNRATAENVVGSQDICGLTVSSRNVLPDQKFRSSLDFSLFGCPETLTFMVYQNQFANENIEFDIAEDVSGEDPTILKNLHGSLTINNNFNKERNLYIGNPRGAINDFRVVALKEEPRVRLTPPKGLCAVSYSIGFPFRGQSFRSSEDFNFYECPGTKLLWHIYHDEPRLFPQVIFDVAEDRRGKRDKTIFRNLKDGSVTPQYQSNANLYIGNPRATGDLGFKAFVYGITPPNDPDYVQQWGYTNIDMPLIWNETSTQVIDENPIAVAVIDTGIWAHPDLPPLSPNNASFNGDHHEVGRNAANIPEGGDLHGVHVAGIIGALTNNGVGVAGTPWVTHPGDGIDLIAVKAMDADGNITIINIIQSTYYAAGLAYGNNPVNQNPARVINMSFNSIANAACPQVLEETISRAVNEGSAVIVSAGNRPIGTDDPAFPADCDSVTLTVGATDRNNQLARFSNFGYNDLSAPGVDIFSTWRNPDYISHNGTSQATPFVSGAAVVLLQKNNQLNPQNIHDLLIANAQPYGDNRMGQGILRVPAAFDSVVHPEDTFVEATNDQLSSYDEVYVTNNETENDERADFVPGEIIVRFNEIDPIEATQRLLGTRALVALPESPGIDIPVLLRLNDSLTSSMDEEELKQTTLDIIDELINSQDVRYAEPNYIITLDDGEWVS